MPPAAPLDVRVVCKGRELGVMRRETHPGPSGHPSEEGIEKQHGGISPSPPWRGAAERRGGLSPWECGLPARKRRNRRPGWPRSQEGRRGGQESRFVGRMSGASPDKSGESEIIPSREGWPKAGVGYPPGSAGFQPAREKAGGQDARAPRKEEAVGKEGVTRSARLEISQLVYTIVLARG